MHYLALGLAGATYYVFLGWARRQFLGSADAAREVKVDDAIVQFFLAAFVVAAAAFVLYFWPQGSGEE